MVDPDEVDGAAGVVLPGVGAFGRCAAALERTGLGEAARRAIESGVPFLGICVGFQLLYERSRGEPGLGGARRLGRGDPAAARGGEAPPDAVEPPGRAVRAAASRLLEGQPASPWVYFVHSYAPEIGPETVATCDYGGPVAAAAEHGNVWGTQFHPEKSGTAGLALLANFVARCAATAPAG